MTTDWKLLATQIGAIRSNPPNGESGGDQLARKALELALGEEWITSTVDHILDQVWGSEVAMSCLRYLCSEKAVRYCYQIYQQSTGKRKSEAVWLIKHIGHPVAFQWVEEFIRDENTSWGIGVLDQLLWTQAISYTAHRPRVDELLALAAENDHLKDSVEFIRTYLDEREKML